jgi:hypothetical protein
VNARETWSWRELPILERALARFDAGDHLVDLQALQSELPALEPAQFRAALNALDDAGYLKVSFTMGGPDRVTGHIDRAYERTRRELGSWPTPEVVVDELAAELSAAADAEDEPERKGKLRAAGDALAGAARDLAVQVLASRLGKL